MEPPTEAEDVMLAGNEGKVDGVLSPYKDGIKAEVKARLFLEEVAINFREDATAVFNCGIRMLFCEGNF
jgi:hypothetical protein